MSGTEMTYDNLDESKERTSAPETSAAVEDRDPGQGASTAHASVAAVPGATPVEAAEHEVAPPVTGEVPSPVAESPAPAQGVAPGPVPTAEPSAEELAPAAEPTTMAELLASAPELTAEAIAIAAGERRATTPADVAEAAKAARRGKPRLRLAQLEVGTEIRGKVVGIAQFGAFVDIGAVTDGLVHITEFAQRHVQKVEDVMKQGDTVAVWVKEIDLENGRVALSMRPRDLRPIESLQVGEAMEGTVTSLTPYGAFVDIKAGTEGLLHVSEMSTRRIGKPEDVVAVGDTVSVWIKDVDLGAGRVSLSMRPQDLRPLDALAAGESFEGTVTSVTNYGAFVDFGAETDGLVHVSEMADRRIGGPEEVAKVGDTVTVWVKDVDLASRRVSLSMRARPSRPIGSLEVDQVLSGTVSSVTRYGVFVNIGSDTDGLVHVSAMGSGFVKDPSEYLRSGQSVEVRVTSVDLERNRIGLSMVGLSTDVGGEIQEAAAESEAEEDYVPEPEVKMPTVVELALRKALGQDADEADVTAGSERGAGGRKGKRKPQAKGDVPMTDLYSRMLEEYRSKKQ